MTNTNRTLTTLIASTVLAVAFATPALAASADTARPARAPAAKTAPATVVPAKMQATKKVTKASRTKLPREWVWTKRATRLDGMFRK